MENDASGDLCKHKKTKSSSGKRNKENEVKSFVAQVSCLCNKKCAQNVDVLDQQEMFEKFTNCSDWSQQTRFLRSLISVQPITKKLDPMVDTKTKENTYKYHLFDASGSLIQVCLQFFTKVLQVSRSKVFRAVDSTKKNPQAIAMRGGNNSRRTNAADLKYLKDFINKLVSYDSNRNSNSKNLHPRLHIRVSRFENFSYIKKK